MKTAYFVYPIYRVRTIDPRGSSIEEDKPFTLIDEGEETCPSILDVSVLFWWESEEGDIPPVGGDLSDAAWSADHAAHPGLGVWPERANTAYFVCMCGVSAILGVNVTRSGAKIDNINNIFW